MNQNPKVVYFDNGYAIRFIRNNWKVLLWVQDLCGKKMKSEVINLPVVSFSSKKEAEQEIKNTVIPYLLKNKNVELRDIVGW